jgi:curved DNA-binding protein CbpA
VLGLSGRVSPADIEAAYRARVRDAHPDRGGDHLQMVELNLARQQALSELGAA